MKENQKKSVCPTCPICHIPFDAYYHNPRIVTKCGHTFCQKCINNKAHLKANRKIFICTQCNSESIIRKNVNQQFTKNLTILAVVKDIKKQNVQQSHVGQIMCTEHNKPLQFKCQTCQQILICSICALFGSHKSHTFSQANKASVKDLQDLKQTFDILTSSIESTVLPQSENNIMKKWKNDTVEALQKLIKIHFRQYYEPIQRKQQQLLNECNDMEINGSIQNSIDKILRQYDSLKIQYQNCCRNNSSLDNVEQLIKRVQTVHSQIQIVYKCADDQVSKYVHDLAQKLNNLTIFKHQQIPFTLKNLIEGKQLKTPTKHKPTFSFDKVKQVQVTQYNYKQSPKSKNQANHLSFNSDEYFIPKPEKKRQSSQIGKKSQLPPNPKSKNSLKHISNKIVPDTSDFIYQKPNENQNRPQSLNKSQLVDKKTLSQNKELVSAHDITHKEQKLQLKYNRPTKEITYQLRSKLQQITKQIDRQQGLNNLQLIGLDINDTLLQYSLQYMRTKKIKFSMIKLVKNNITDQGFKILLSFLQKDSYTKVVNMTGNHLSSKIIPTIIQSAQENKILKTIYLTNNKISPFHIKAKKAELEHSDIQIIL